MGRPATFLHLVAGALLRFHLAGQRAGRLTLFLLLLLLLLLARPP